MNGLLLAEDDALERFLQRAQTFAVRRRGLPCGNASHPGDDRFDVGGLHDRFRRLRTKAGDCAGFVEQVDRAVWKTVVAQVARRELRRRLERGAGVLDAVMLRVPASQTREDADGL